MRAILLRGERRVTGIPAYRRVVCILGVAILAIALLLHPSSGFAQQQNDISQQLQLFNSMTPDQQQAILQRLNGQGDQTGLGATGGQLGIQTGLPGTNLNGSQSLLQQQLQLQQRRRLLSGQTLDQTQLNEPPIFKPGDTVLVQVSLLPELPKGAQTPLNSVPIQAQPGTLQQPQPPQPTLGSGTLNGQRLQDAPQRTIEELQADEKARLQEMIGQIRLDNPYEIDRDGNLRLPGIPPMAIAGLTEDLATRRVSANVAFDKVQLTLTRLPIDKSGKDALKPFGYDLFDNSSVGLLPMLNLPVPSDYVVGPGDTLQVQLFGSLNQNLRLTVSRNGQVNFPQIGPVQVAGQRFSAMQSDIEGRVSRQIIGTRASVSMGEVRSINVFVLGNAKYPGSYAVSSLATVTTALFAAGGVQSYGSLRTIQVKRQGQLLRNFDLYDLLMRGDSSSDMTLQAGDVVFIPPVGPVASISGEVQRPAIYELKGEQSLADLIRMGGGLTPDADGSSAALVRVDPAQRRVVLSVDPSAPGAGTIAVRNADLLQISRLRPQLDSGITVQGFVYRQKYVAWHEGIRISEVIPSVDDLKNGADQNYLLIRRELLPNRHVAVLSADLAAALQAPGSSVDVTLMPRDKITVFDKNASRQWVVGPVLGELQLQANAGEPTRIVHVEGQVKAPGEYPLEPGMHVSDLVRAGGGLDPAAYEGRAELSRYTIENGNQRSTEVIEIDLSALRSGDRAADVVLQPFDRLSVKQITGWAQQDQVTLRGEVRYPGVYAVRPGETLQSVVRRAGGLTTLAFADASLFTRTELKVREQEQLDRLAVRLRTEIAEVALMGVRAQQGAAPAALSVGETVLRQLSEAKAIGRLVIDLRAVMAGKMGSSDDVILRNGDTLIVPRQRQEVMVLGEVQDPTSHLYKRDISRDDYIAQSGGPTRQADKRRIYVVRANGSVDAGSRGWFHNSDGVQIHPGDAIVVPLDTERLPALTVWTAVTTILYNVAIAAAEVHSTIP
jgi:polysaccharide biosynthesis/export protein